MEQALKNYQACEQRKSMSEIRREVRLCREYWGCYPLHYFRYELYRRDKVVSEDQLLDYVPEYFFYDLYLPQYNRTKYTALTDDKNVSALIFNAIKVRQPLTICRLVNGSFLDEANNSMGTDEVLKTLKGVSRHERVFVKPAYGSGGSGIIIFHHQTDGYRSSSGELLDGHFLENVARRGDFIVQWGVEQQEDLAAVYPHSLNTFRIATEKKEGKARLLCATLRMGRNGSQVDNGSQGGIMAAIDLRTGTTLVARSETCESFATHPDTGFSFREWRVPEWKAVMEFTLDCARRFPFSGFLGWDIAISSCGPIVVEVNAGFGIDHYQVSVGGLRNILGISSPQSYWEKPLPPDI